MPRQLGSTIMEHAEGNRVFATEEEEVKDSGEEWGFAVGPEDA